MFCAGLGARCVPVDKDAILAYINVPLSTYCKTGCVSKLTSASRGSPCGSTVFLLKQMAIKNAGKVCGMYNSVIHEMPYVDNV